MNKVHANLIGQKFNRLLVTSFSHQTESVSKKIKTVEYWNCLCDCGNEKIISGYCLVASNVKSCGCYTIEKLKSNGKPLQERGLRKVCSIYKSNALSKEHVFNLTFEEAEKLFTSNCFYCNKPPSNEIKTVIGGVKYNGIDRKNNEPFYSLENSVSCCKVCNISKNDKNFEQFNSWIERLYNNLCLEK